MVVLDLFSGAGGLTEGFFKEGYCVASHVEKEKWTCETLKTRIIFHFLKEKGDLDSYNNYIINANGYKNINDRRKFIYNKYPELKKRIKTEVLNKTFGNPANEKEATSTRGIISLIEKSLSYNNKASVDLIIGGPPCQAYSVIGRARMKETVCKDKRNYLFYYYKEIVRHFNPRYFIFENVPGILNTQGGSLFKRIKVEFNNIGFKLLSGPLKKDELNILDSSDFGVYQTRKRLILFGYREDMNARYPDFKKYALKDISEHKTTRNIIGDLPKLKPGKGNDFWLTGYSSEEDLSGIQKYLSKDSIGVTNHKARSLNAKIDWKIYKIAIKMARNGQQLRYPDLPKNLKTHKNEKSFNDRFKVHWWDDIPHTIVAHIAKDGHYNIHPDIKQCRSLTVREAARIQSFPDNYLFEGPRTWQYIQVGNAVPPLMSQAMAKALKDVL